MGILVQIALHKTFMINDASASGAPIVLIGVGVVIFFIAFFGCCGAWKENYCMVTMVSAASEKPLIKQKHFVLFGFLWYRVVYNVQNI